MSKEKKILHLVLSDKAWQVTGTTEKMFELRKRSKWIESRLFDKNGNERHYDEVWLRNGYRAGAEVKKFGFLGVSILDQNANWSFGDLDFFTQKGDYVIHLMDLL